MMTSNVHAVANNDAELVSATLSGNREAFGQIVTRYQSLICSLAYSATGSLGQSEDLAQETFITAWKHLRHLREQNKLRAWLCGIARNRINNSLRREGREPVLAAEPLETVHESPSHEPLPHDQTINKEEEAILWRSLERIPEIYREPLVLFYREHQSIAAVAEELELTEDNVKQRLSRGRKMLAEEVTSFVETALTRTNPGKAFTVGVLAALPLAFATSAKAATLGVAAAKGGATATGTSFLAVLGALCGPLIGLVGGYLGLKVGLASARTPRERALIIRQARIAGGGIVTFVATLLGFVYCGRSLWEFHPVLFIIAGVAITTAYAVFMFGIAWKYNRKFAALRDAERQLHPEAYANDPPPAVREYRSHAKFLGLPLVHCRFGRVPGQRVQPAIGWIAFGERAYGILFACGAVAIGAISFGGMSLGLLSFGGISVGLLTFGGFAIGGLALGGAAIGIVASGGIAVGWHAAVGGIAAAREFAVGGAGLAQHVNDPAAHEFFAQHRWLDITQTTTRNVFWIVSFAPILLQALAWGWWQKWTARQRGVQPS